MPTSPKRCSLLRCFHGAACLNSVHLRSVRRRYVGDCDPQRSVQKADCARREHCKRTVKSESAKIKDKGLLNSSNVSVCRQ